ncbi:non-ribosomal peptide synthetase [Cellulomonas phragmiteti]|uniref:Non-ribosomal peptide synthetase n=1 Tax=Cellulomonas phragmiteti TaxID=478780 RepID=A0ABQ4DPE1_9CELL|nr:non-ribosomal peptide synthetase [Cellulomonas phragmiteti]
MAPAPALTAAQEGVVADVVLGGDGWRYNCGSAYHLTGTVDVGRLAAAVQAAGVETECLAARLVEGPDGTWRQVPHPVPPLAVVDDLDPVAVRERMDRALATPRPLDGDDLCEHTLFRTGPDRAVLFVRYHHALMDGLGQTLHVARIAGHYSGTAGEPPAVTYGDAVAAAGAYRGSDQEAADAEFWAAHDPDDATSLSVQETRASGVHRARSRLDPALAERLRTSATALGARPAALLIAAAAIYQGRMDGTASPVLDIPVPARPTARMLRVPAMFANELPLRTALDLDDDFAAHVARVSSGVADLLRHQRFRREDLARRRATAGAPPRLPATVVNVVGFAAPPVLAGLGVRVEHLSAGPVRDVKLTAYQGPGDVELVLETSAARYAPHEAAAHLDRYVALLDGLLADPTAPVREVPLGDAAERRLAATAGRGPARRHPVERPLQVLVAEQCARTPDAVAVSDADGADTYAGLAARCAELAHRLAGVGVRPGDAVGVLLDRGRDLAVAHLGILWAGAAFVPLDPAWPAARVASCTADSGLSVVVTDRLALPGAPEATPVAVPDLASSAAATTLPATDAPAGPQSPAYVLFTSGSTGRPKGVVVPHEGIVNRLCWMRDLLAAGPDDVVLQKTPTTFDVSVWEFFLPLLSGGRVHFPPPDAHRDPRQIAQELVDKGVTIAHFVPSMLDVFTEHLEATGAHAAALTRLRALVCSGEALAQASVDAVLGALAPAGGVRLLNLYGPTEASVDVTVHECVAGADEAAVPIGRAVDATGITILSGLGEPLPVGRPGELRISGIQVALGYAGRPELTAAAFGTDPATGERTYRTGDRAVLAADGTVRYLGRDDGQVKIRGVRIETGEVEQVLRDQPAVTQAAVVLVAGGTPRAALAAYVVGDGVDPDALRATMAARLPASMVPAHLVVLDALPLTAHGKLDRGALPEPAPATTDAAAATGPLSPAEAALATAFAAVLDLPRAVGRDDSFFAVGGDSILALRLRSHVEAAGFAVDLADLYACPTPRLLAPRLRPVEVGDPDLTMPFSLLTAQERAGLPDGLDDAYPLSRMQAAMVHHATPGTSVYRVVTSVHVAAALDVAALEAALADAVARHPSLRLSVDLTGADRPLQLVHSAVRVPVEVDDSCAALADPGPALAAWAADARFWDVDLTAPPLLRVVVHPRSDGTVQVSAIEHHVVLDGWSDAVLLDEVLRDYLARVAGQEPPRRAPLVTTYRDFVAAELDALADPRHAAFWRERLAGAEASPLPAPATRRGPSDRRHQLALEVPASLAADLYDTCARHGVALKHALAAVHAKVVGDLTSTSEPVTGVVGHARPATADADRVVGVFLNTLPVRVPLADTSWLEVAARLAAGEADATPHRAYPYPAIAADLPDLGIDTYVNLMDFHQGWESVPGIESGFGVAETDFALTANFLVDPTTRELGGYLDVDTSRVDPDVAHRMPGYYLAALRGLAEDPDAAPWPLDLRSDDERRRAERWAHGPSPEVPAATVVEAVERLAATDPGRPAVHSTAGSLTYGGLAAEVGALSVRLTAQGAGPGTRVGLHVTRGSGLVVAMLAVLRTGAAYVPLDPDFPAERLEYIARDAGPVCVVSDAPDVAPAAGVPVLALHDATDADVAGTAVPPPAVVSPDSPAYVIYTSGSTGRPKGTVLTHGNLGNFLVAMDEAVGFGPQDRLLALTSVSFDISILELLWPVARGGQVLVAPGRLVENLAHGRESLTGLIGSFAPTHLQATPSFLAAAVTLPEPTAALAGVGTVLVGGEALPLGLARVLADRAPGTRLINMYGPTETTIWSTTAPVPAGLAEDAGPLAIGRPVAHTVVRVTTTDGRELPLGVSGELWIGGAGVAVGYHERPELTAERFTVRSGDGRGYRTGDRVRWTEHGDLVFQGRLDRQVKILGQRVELDEIESTMSRHPAVAGAAVIARPTGTGHELTAYVVPRPGDDGSADQRERWRDLWDAAYAAEDDATSRFSGWTSSYTGEPLPTAHMRRWVEATVRRLEALPHRRVVDVGCGVGLVLEHLVATCESYRAFDVAPHALDRALSSVPSELRHRVTTGVDDALALRDLDDGSADLVVLNSVVQYFPSEAYLTEVLGHAMRVAGPAGAVVVGDVRDLRLVEAFHADTQSRRLPPGSPAGDLAATVRRLAAAETELCLAPAYFAGLAATRPGWAVRLLSRTEPDRTEMSRFRWDAVLLGPDHPERAHGAPEVQVAWDEDTDLASPAGLAALAGAGGRTRVTGVPSSRLHRPAGALAAAADDGLTVRDVQRRAWAADRRPGCDPAVLADVAAAAGVAVQAGPAACGDPYLLDVDLVAVTR